MTAVTFVEYYPSYGQLQVTNNLVVRQIESVTQAYPAVLTTTVDHGYVAGMMVTFLIPPSFGMVQLNNLTLQVLSVTANTLSLNVDTTSFAPFVAYDPSPNAFTPASVIPQSSGAYFAPLPLPYGNENSFEGVIYNSGLV